MSWERALEADARLAAKNSVLIRAALRQSVDFEAAFRGYEATSPDTTLSLPQQRTRARAWAIINIRVNLEAFKEVLYRVWAQAYALGDLAAREQIDLARQAQKKVDAGVNWETWKPGDAASAIILKPPKAFQNLLKQQGITFKGFSDTTLRDLGNAIGEAIELGLDARTSAKRIMNHVASPARALSIAITEQNRAISEATKERYLSAGLQKMEWLVFDPCEICAKNEGVKNIINQPFPSGDTQPPAHPNCRCALAPVIPGMDEVDQAPGATIVTPPVTTPVSREELTTLLEEPEPVIGAFKPGEWKELTKDEIRESVISLYVAKTGKTREAIELYIQKGFIGSGDLELLRNGTVYRNGPIEIQFYASGAKVKADEKKKFLESVDAIQTYAPKDKMIITVAKEKKGAYGSAILGDAQIFLRPSVVSDDLPKEKELGFKMPVIAEVAHRDYVLAHEWGHSIDIGGSFGRTVSIQNPATKETIKRLQKKYANDPLAIRSGYSGENTKEFYAEMFAEWYLTKGTTKNPLVQEMAQALGWAKFKVSRSGRVSSLVEQDASEQNYRGYHRAPSRADDVGGPATDIETGLMPDFYARPNIYTTGMPQADKESVRAIMAIRNKPDAKVTVYRAVPIGVEKINPGDWVTLSPSYAESHLLSNVETGHVISMEIPAKDLWFDGNSINEFGYDPVSK
jgi:hypothetical protein